MSIQLARRSYDILTLGLDPNAATTGVWTTQLSSNLLSLHKAAAATTSVVTIPIPRSPRLPSLAIGPFLQVAVIEVFYKVTTANLTSAPTAVLNRQTAPGGLGTGTVARLAINQTLTFAGLDTIGTIQGDHIAVITPSPLPILDDYDSMYVTLTMNEAATSVLDIFGITVTYQ